MGVKIQDMPDEFFESLKELKKSFLSQSSCEEVTGYNTGLEVAVYAAKK